MNPPRSQRLQRVADVAGKRTDEAANAMAERLRGLDSAKHQLEELQQFRKDYALQPGAPAGPGLSVAELMNRQQFIVRIDQAIAQQQRDVEQHTRNVAKARTTWLESRSRSAALDTVSQRYRDKEHAAEERSEQAAIDERMQLRKDPWPAP